MPAGLNKSITGRTNCKRALDYRIGARTARRPQQPKPTRLEAIHGAGPNESITFESQWRRRPPPAFELDDGTGLR